MKTFKVGQELTNKDLKHLPVGSIITWYLGSLASSQIYNVLFFFRTEAGWHHSAGRLESKVTDKWADFKYFVFYLPEDYVGETESTWQTWEAYYAEQGFKIDGVTPLKPKVGDVIKRSLIDDLPLGSIVEGVTTNPSKDQYWLTEKGWGHFVYYSQPTRRRVATADYLPTTPIDLIHDGFTKFKVIYVPEDGN